MPILSVEKQYVTRTTPTAQQITAIFESVETFVNVTKVDSVNIQDGAITADLVEDEAITTEAIESNAVTLGKLASSVTSLLVPAGAVRPYVGTSAPTGWLLCNGNAVSRATYSALFSAIGETHGEGDNSTTFNVPDYRGRFLRVVDDGAGRDLNAASRTAMATGGNTGDNVGSLQGQAVSAPTTPIVSGSSGAHTHTFTGYELDAGGGGGILTPVFNDSSAGNNGTYTVTSGSSGSHSHTINGGGDNETRPTNAYVNFIIKT